MAKQPQPLNQWLLAVKLDCCFIMVQTAEISLPNGVNKLNQFLNVYNGLIFSFCTYVGPKPMGTAICSRAWTNSLSREHHPSPAKWINMTFAMITSLLSSKVQVGFYYATCPQLERSSFRLEGPYNFTWALIIRVIKGMLNDHKSACGCGQGCKCAKWLLHFQQVFIFSFSFSQIFFSCLYRIRLFVYRRATYCHLMGNLHIFIEIRVRKCYVTICKTINNIILIF